MKMRKKYRLKLLYTHELVLNDCYLTDTCDSLIVSPIAIIIIASCQLSLTWHDAIISDNAFTGTDGFYR